MLPCDMEIEGLPKFRMTTRAASSLSLSVRVNKVNRVTFRFVKDCNSFVLYGYLYLTIQNLSLRNITPARVRHLTGSVSQVRGSARALVKKTHTTPYPQPLPKQPLLYQSWRSSQDCLLA